MEERVDREKKRIRNPRREDDTVKKRREEREGRKENK